MTDLTVVYYSSNREDPVFEGKIRQALQKAIGDLPLISVTQQPTDFGENLCVGDVGRSGHNVFRQYQIGVQAAKTRYVAPAESDALYPPGWFQSRPLSDDVLVRCIPVYLCFAGGYWAGKFWPKNHWEGATMVSRDYILRQLDALLKDKPLWRDGVEVGPEGGDDHPCLFRSAKLAKWISEVPAISFRTPGQMHKKACFKPKDAQETLPHWGTPDDLLRKFWQ